MKKLVVLLLVAAAFTSCSENKKQTKEEMAEDFKTYEDSLFNSEKSGGQKDVMKSGIQYAERCLSMAHQFPKDEAAAAYMDKAHMAFAGMQLYGRSVLIADSIIMLYPRYKNRAMVLESAASTYDMFILPRNKAKIKEYYELLLEENPKLPKERRDEIKFRIENIDLTYNEMIGLQKTKP